MMKNKRTTVHTFMSHETKILGYIEFTGNVRIDSYLEGNVKGRDGVIIFGEKAFMRGDIDAESVVIMGVMEGTVDALDSVEVSATGKVLGNISAPNVNFEPGAVFVGKCNIGVKLEPRGEERQVEIEQFTEVLKETV